MINKLFLLLFCVINLPVFADTLGASTDSSQIAPPDITHGKRHGFVLSSGVCALQCRGGSGCNHMVSDESCPVGYTPSVATGVVSGAGSGIMPIKRIVLQPQPGQLIATRSGYMLHFAQAYIQAYTTGSPSPVTINYSVYCS